MSDQLPPTNSSEPMNRHEESNDEESPTISAIMAPTANVANYDIATSVFDSPHFYYGSNGLMVRWH